MKLPHWLRHHWSPWEPKDTAHSGGGIFLSSPSRYDMRACERCGRRQVRGL